VRDAQPVRDGFLTQNRADPEAALPITLFAGMESSESYGIDFRGAVVAREKFIGDPGNFYREPLFRGGAIRFAAVHAGAILRLHRLFTEWLQREKWDGDPYQVSRLGEVALGAQEAVLWIERAAATAEDTLKAHADRGRLELPISGARCQGKGRDPRTPTERRPRHCLESTVTTLCAISCVDRQGQQVHSGCGCARTRTRRLRMGNRSTDEGHHRLISAS
jgi:hypothetical protein